MLNNDIKPSMKVCASYVRLCKCQKCLHFQQCVLRGEPISELGRFYAGLVLLRVPAIEKRINAALDDEIKLHVLHSQKGMRGAPFDEEALAVVSVEAKNYSKTRKRIILKDYGDNLILEVLIAYAKIVRRKAKKGNENESN